MTNADRLRSRLLTLLVGAEKRAFFVENGCGAADTARIAAIDRELNRLARRRAASRARRELMFDLNGHHGPA